MMVREIQEPFNLSLLENSIHSGSVSFGRFEKEALSWETRSSFSHNRYLEEAEKFSKPGSVTQMRAHFEAHFKKKGIRFPTSVEAQTLGEAVHHHQTGTEKDEKLWDSMSQCSHHSYEQDKCDQERSQFGDSCVSYDDEHSSLSVAMEKSEIGCSEITLEDEKETKVSSVTRSKPLKNVRKAITYAAGSTKKHAVITKGSPSCNYTKTSTIDTKRQKELKPKRIVKTIASQAQISKKTERVSPLSTTNKYRSKSCIDSATREKRTPTNGFSFRTNERAEKRKEDVVRKALDYKARPMPKSTQARPQNTLKGQANARDDAQEHSCKASCDRSLANGPAKSKLNAYKQRLDLKKSLNGILTKSSDQTARNNVNRKSMVVRLSAVEVAL
ncbi:unnamed protein product [Arabis nemorensis]|uniref:TPX2 C-terminal domain-containing protein n=1 Tax=Arabis nemorensis TaxID=586526 RepID=A0A565AS89_9BRAS|nr:unnamed protein product [Arabis nemorensis]